MAGPQTLLDRLGEKRGDRKSTRNWAQFTPKLMTVMRDGYGLSQFKSDAVAGFTVAVIALPLAMALGIASGASPDKGLLTAIVAGFFISFLGFAPDGAQQLGMGDDPARMSGERGEKAELLWGETDLLARLQHPMRQQFDLDVPVVTIGMSVASHCRGLLT